MEMRKCMNGHYFDASIHSKCPYCGSVNTVKSVTRDITQSSFDWDDDKTMPLGPENVFLKAEERKEVKKELKWPKGNAFASIDEEEEDEKTVVLVENQVNSNFGQKYETKPERNIDAVVGWLVCLNNEYKGQDYKIHGDNNYIGVHENMDIYIKGDDSISKERFAIISYDYRDNIFYFSPREGREIFRVNEKAVFTTVELKPYDVITLGKTELLFVPLCGENFKWN